MTMLSLWVMWGDLIRLRIHDFIIDVFNKIYQKNNTAKLILVGAGNGQQNIIDKVKNLALSDSVLFLGNRTDVNKILQAMDVFLFPSLYEGLPLSIIEAQAASYHALYPIMFHRSV